MLNSIHLTNFRQHTDKLVNFNAGNTALRGENEAGKTTVIEAVMYLMGGSKRCRNADFVTWGAKPSSTKVEGVFTFNGISVRATRGQRGAELYVPADAKKPTITGQNEVTAWFAEQFGAPLDVVEKMSFAGQKEIGGLLDEGNAKAVEFIEKMSGLDIVEWIIGQIEAKGECGPTGSIDDRIASAREQIMNAEAVDYDSAIAHTEKEIAPLAAKQAEISEELNTRAEPLKAARERLRAVGQYLATEVQLDRNVSRAVQEHADAHTKLNEQTTAVAALREPEVIESDLAQLREQQANEDRWTGVCAAKRKFDAYEAPEMEWAETGEAGLREFINEQRAAVKKVDTEVFAINAAVAQIDKEIAVTESKRVTSSACGLCGKDVSELPGVKVRNGQLDDHVIALRNDRQKLTSQIPALQAAKTEAEENVEAGESILRSPRFETALQFPDLFKIDTTFVPFRVEWVGPEIDFTAPRPTFASEIVRVNNEMRARHNADQQLATLRAGAENAERRLAAARDELAQHRATKLNETEGQLNALIEQFEENCATLRTQLNEVVSRLGELQGQLKSLTENAERHKQQVSRLKQLLAEDEAKAAKYQFNNDLIAALRRARPVVGNTLWNMVLQAVSTYLTRMRKEPSEVTREGKTFLINGKPYTSYSGSALDLLGLGIRVALTKVFVPGADMLVLDEPFSACSAERTQACLAFAASAGFGQTIVITHEAGTEEVFDNILEV
jgi:DNA repair exonuclease SbcCD ATPase subunit